MALEVFFFRSLLRNDRAELKPTQKLVYSSNRFLWAGGLLFHGCLAIILFRHLRFFTEPVIPGVASVQSLDGLFHAGLPALISLMPPSSSASATFFCGRIIYPQIRLISLASDYLRFC